MQVETVMDKALVDQVVGAAAAVVASGAISANGHGNISVRVPGAAEMYFTSAPSLRGLGPVGAFGIAAAMLSSLTLLPMALVLLGRRAFWPLMPRYQIAPSFMPTPSP